MWTEDLPEANFLAKPKNGKQACLSSWQHNKKIVRSDLESRVLSSPTWVSPEDMKDPNCSRRHAVSSTAGVEFCSY